MDPPGRSPTPGLTLGHYRLLERIGAGGMGEVWRARDERLERDVALKLLLPGTLADEAARKRFRREALSLSRLAHPNIATVFDFDSEGGLDFLVMEYVAGPEVTEHLAEGPLPEAEVARLGVQLAEGLAAAHAQGVVHRDLKPGNVRLTPDGRLKILDFGLAKLVRPTEGRSLTESLTEAQALVGTLAYMAPEQVRGEAADARSDLWAAGLVLYELATGKRAYAEERSAQVLYAILNQTPAAPRSLNGRVSAGLEAIILKCLEREVGKRYQSAAELAADVTRLLGGLTVEAERARVQARRVRTLAIAVPVGAVVLLAALTALNVGGLRSRLFAPAPIRSIAVLPLANLSGDASQEYFADGMTEALINDLGKVSALRVISRTSAMAYKGAKKPLPQIARELGVDAIVEGSVSRSGERVKISAQLIRAKGERQLWSDAYERDLKDVLILQGEMAGTIAGAVKARLTPEERRRLASKRPINPRAYELYLRGRYHLFKLNEDGIRKGFDYMRQAVEVDSASALAYYGVGNAYWFSAVYGLMPASEAWPKARAAGTKAISLDDDLPEAHALLAAGLYMFEWNWNAAEREFDRTLALDPRNPDNRDARSLYCMAVGRWDEGVNEARRAVELDPVSAATHLQLAFCLYYARRFDESIAECKETLELDQTRAYAGFILSLNYGQKRMYAEACAEMRKVLEALPEDQVILAGAGMVFGRAGRRDEALGFLGRLRRRSEKTYVEPYNVAWLFDGLGEVDSAMVWLDRGYRERSANMYMLRSETWTDRLRADPRFQALVRRMNYPPERKR